MTGTRQSLHQVAVHVLARRRAEVSGRFGLRASPGGFATPAFGPEPEVVRISGTTLIHEIGGASRLVPLAGASLQQLADVVGAHLEQDFQAGPESPALGDASQPLEIDAGEASRIAEWYAIGWETIDEVAASLGDGVEATTVQLWPEHFDAGSTVSLGPAGKVNLGFSPGDAWCDEPYVYLGPWEAARPGDPSYWNAPFGAALTRTAIERHGDLVGSCRAFLEVGLRTLATPS